MQEVRVPVLGESITEATVVKINKKVGEFVKEDEVLFELETDKVTMEVNSPANGIITEIKCKVGDTVAIKALLAILQEGNATSAPKSSALSKQPETEPSKSGAGKLTNESEGKKENNFKLNNLDNNLENDSNELKTNLRNKPNASNNNSIYQQQDSPAARFIMNNEGIDSQAIKGSGTAGRITKLDLLTRFDNAGPAAQTSQVNKNNNVNNNINNNIAADNNSNISGNLEPLTEQPSSSGSNQQPTEKGTEQEKIVPVSKMRQMIALNLKKSQNTAATLTTFNEVDMQPIMQIRARYKDAFEKKYGVKLGFMSFFVKAVIAALQELPEINAEIKGENIIYKNYCNIGVAVGAPSGLVVPVIRNAEKLSIAEIEKEIVNLGKKAKDNKLTAQDMKNGTFTISNGGVYGSLMSTPILNPPQSGILGMHAIKERAVVIEGKIEIRPMMYLALSYDHRIVDGQGAVTFLVKVKNYIEDPARLILNI